MQHHIPRVLSIAGSDSGGGAGIQADLKAFAACGVHGMTAVTAITAQNTTGVTDIHPIPPATILAQVRAIALDIGIDAVKVGMVGNEAAIQAVAQALDELPEATPMVVDPVLVAESGSTLLEPEAQSALTSQLLPRATVATPNLPEAAALTGRKSASQEELARALLALGPKAVVVTGGHGQPLTGGESLAETGEQSATDLFYDGTQLVEIGGERHPGGASHGSGCTHSSVLASALAWGWEPLEAARLARSLAAQAVKNGLRELGAGAGPVDVLGLTTREPERPAPNGRRA
jgi:hydroxymethylpyrimidine/phosphomethylpyrimidine kinase